MRIPHIKFNWGKEGSDNYQPLSGGSVPGLEMQCCLGSAVTGIIQATLAVVVVVPGDSRALPGKT